MAITFQRATKHASRLRLAFIGPAGSGKTYSSLAVAAELGGRVAVIDTERGSASKYANLFAFDVHEMESCSPDAYVQAIHVAESAGYDVIIVDSLSHAWIGRDGALQMVDDQARREKGNSFGAWRTVTPKHNAMVDALTSCSAHLVVTMRSKTEWVVEEHNGKKVPRKIGLAPVQRDGLEYEFDVVGDLDQENMFAISKSRCPQLSGKVIDKPGKQLADTLLAWLGGPARPPAPALEPTVEPDGDMVAALQASIAFAKGQGLEALSALAEELKALPEGPPKQALRKLYKDAWKAALKEQEKAAKARARATVPFDAEQPSQSPPSSEPSSGTGSADSTPTTTSSGSSHLHAE